MLEDLRTAIDEEDWTRALSLALVAWRRDRVPALADLIDLIGARCPRPLPRSRRGLHNWWIRTAVTYDPLDVDRLVATADEQRRARVDAAALAKRHETNALVRALAALSTHGIAAYFDHTAWIDRAAVILDWHDDPRWAVVLARWLAPPHERMRIYGTHQGYYQDVGEVFYRALAKRLGELGDARVLPLLDGNPFAEEAIAEIRRRAVAPAPELAAELAAIAAPLAPAATALRDPLVETGLWAGVAAAPDDIAPRLVLADYLIQHGDPRGELIVLQNTPTPHAATLANKLVSAHGKRWLGELTYLCTRRGTVWQRGMLHEIRIGMLDSPARAFEAVRGHRELACVRTVVPSQIAPERHAEVLDALPSVSHLVLHTVEMAAALARLRSRWPFRMIELGTRDPGWSIGSVIPEILDILAPICPEVVEIVVTAQHRGMPPRPEVLDPLARIHDWFPALQHVRIPQHELEGHYVLRALPFVEGYVGGP